MLNFTILRKLNVIGVGAGYAIASKDMHLLIYMFKVYIVERIEAFALSPIFPSLGSSLVKPKWHRWSYGQGPSNRAQQTFIKITGKVSVKNGPLCSFRISRGSEFQFDTFIIRLQALNR